MSDTNWLNLCLASEHNQCLFVSVSTNNDGKDIVVMHNNLTRHIIEEMTSLSVQDQRIVAYLIAKGIQNPKSDEMPIEIEGSVAEVAHICGITTAGTAYQAVRQATESLMRHLIRFKDPDDGGDVSCTWLAWGKYHEHEGRFTAEFPKPLRKVLVGIRKHRTEMELETLLSLGGGAYALRLYQICKSWESQKVFIAKIETLRAQLGVPPGKLERFVHFKQRALDYPLKAINERSDIRVEYAKHNSGHKWTHLAFSVKPRKRTKTANLPKSGFFSLDKTGQKILWEWVCEKYPLPDRDPSAPSWDDISAAMKESLWQEWVQGKQIDLRFD